MWISRIAACPLVLALMTLSLCTVSPGHAQENGDDVVIGKYHVVHSRILAEERKILVHVPRGYEDTTLEYPVVYHLYGDYELTYFADAVSILHRLHEAGEIPQVILVGVDNTDRYRDLRPVRRDGAPGGSSDFAKCLEKELMPFVDSRYRTADYRILVGPQAGSTFGMYVLMEREGLFDAVIIETSFLSPAPVREYLVDQTGSFFRKDRSLKSFLFMKCRNDEQQPFLDHTKQLANLIESNKPQGFRFALKLLDPADDFIMSTGLKYGMRSLFTGHEFPSDLAVRNLQDVKRYYQDLSKELGVSLNISDTILVGAGDRLNQAGNPAAALEVYDYVLAVYPKSLDGLHRAADIRLRFGQYERAKAHLEAFLEIRPSEVLIREMLRRTDRVINESAAYAVGKAIQDSGLGLALSLLDQLAADESSGKYFSEAEFNNLGYRLLGKNEIEQALEVFRWNAAAHSESANAYDSLGEALMKNGEFEAALENYRKSLALDSDNTNAAEMIRKLESETHDGD